MTTEVRWRKGTSAEHATFTGAQAEITVNTTTHRLHAHDGVTQGGHPVALLSDVNGFQPLSQKGAANGYAPLGADSKVPAAYLPTMAAAASFPGVVSLATYMDQHYGAGSWTGRTGVGAGSDIGPALVAACSYLRTNFGRGTIVIPPGQWLMTTTPTAAQWSGITVWGAGSQSSVITYNSATGVPFSFSGAGGFTGGGVHGIGLLLEEGLGDTNAVAFLLQGDATFQPDQMAFSDIYCTFRGSSKWLDGFKAVGTARTAPQGIRVCTVNNLQIFGCRNTGVYIQNVVQWTLNNIGVYVGTGGGANFYIAGGGTSNTNSTQVYADAIVATEVNITNTSKFRVTGTAGTVAASTGAPATLGDVCVPGAIFSGGFGSGVRTYF
jgi:hypothetical protein